MQPERAGLGITLALHALALAALLSYVPARKALLDAAPVMVDLIAAPQPQSRAAVPHELPKPRPVTRPASTAPQPAADADAQRQAASPVEPATAAPAPIAAAEPAPLAPPVFNAAYLENPAPAYPALSRRLGEQGRVVLRVLVNARGGADEVRLSTPSGFARLDDAARDTVRRWRFVPARRGAENVPAWVLIPISFRIAG